MSFKQRAKLYFQALNGGINDTLFSGLRNPNQTKTQSNVRNNLDGSLESVQGRLAATDQTFGSYSIKGVFCPVQKNPIITLDADNYSLYFYVGGGLTSYYTATLATGSYYTYSSLATALQTALNTAAGSSLFTVTFSYATYKFTISTVATGFNIYWIFSGYTTIDKSIFGFVASSGGAGFTVTSDFAVEEEPLNKMLCFTASKAYIFDGTSQTELKFPTTLSMACSQATGQWRNGVFYGSTSLYSFIIRGDRYVRYIADTIGISSVPAGSSVATIKAGGV